MVQDHARSRSSRAPVAWRWHAAATRSQGGGSQLGGAPQGPTYPPPPPPNALQRRAKVTKGLRSPSGRRTHWACTGAAAGDLRVGRGRSGRACLVHSRAPPPLLLPEPGLGIGWWACEHTAPRHGSGFRPTLRCPRHSEHGSAQRTARGGGGGGRGSAAGDWRAVMLWCSTCEWQPALVLRAPSSCCCTSSRNEATGKHHRGSRAPAGTGRSRQGHGVGGHCAGRERASFSAHVDPARWASYSGHASATRPAQHGRAHRFLDAHAQPRAPRGNQPPRVAPPRRVFVCVSSCSCIERDDASGDIKKYRNRWCR